MLHYTCTGRRASIPKIRRDSDREARLIGRDRLRIICKARVDKQHIANDTIRSGVHNGNVCRSGVRSSNIECEVDDLACGPGLDVGGVVGEFETLAKPDVAFGGVVVRLGGCNLELALDVAVAV